MARCQISPVQLATELQHKMQMTPDHYFERDPRKMTSWDQRRHRAVKNLPYPRYFYSESFLPDKPRFKLEATPDSPEEEVLPPFLPLQPTKLNFSPQTNKGPNFDESSEPLGLMYPYQQDEVPTRINDVHVLFGSPLLQEHIHYLLCDHAIDRPKMERNLRYMGIDKSTFLRYCRLCYPFHYYSRAEGISMNTTGRNHELLPSKLRH